MAEHQSTHDVAEETRRREKAGAAGQRTPKAGDGRDVRPAQTDDREPDQLQPDGR